MVIKQIFCPMALTERGLSNCKGCKWKVKIDEVFVMCDYPYPDKRWFWKRQLDKNYPKKLKVKLK